MKQLKMFGLVLIAALGLSILAGAGAAQATVLCTTADTAECTMLYPGGTVVNLSLKSGTTMVVEATSGSLEDTCSGATVKGTVGVEAGEAASIELSEWSWSSCTQPTTGFTAGSLDIEHIVGTQNGTVIGKGTEWTVEAFKVNCIYGLASGTDLGVLTGGAEPVLDLNAIIKKKSGSFLCPSDSVLTANLVVTEPHALYVSEEAATTTGGVLCTTKDESECTMSYPEGRSVNVSLKSGTTMVVEATGGAPEDTCSSDTVKGTVGSETGEAASIELSESSWSSCTKPTKTLAVGSLTITHIAGTHNGTVISKGNEWTVEAVEKISCVYGGEVDLGTLTGGAEPVLKTNIVINKKAGSSFLCPADSILRAEFVVTSPHALYLNEGPTPPGGVLCTTKDESECTMSYPEGRSVNLSLKSGTTMALKATGGAPEDTCSGDTVKGTVGSETGEAASIELSEWSRSSCNKPTKTIAVGSLEIKHIEGTDNGTVISKGNEWTVEAVEKISCVYGGEVDLGTLTGGAEPVLKVSAVIKKKSGSFLCPEDSTLEAEYVVTEPHALYVA
jgi:hypothetical protein